MKFGLTVEIELHPGKKDLFLPLIEENAKASLKNEKNCLVFNVLHDEKNSDRFFLFEIYQSESAFEEHLKTDHFLSFSAATRGLIKKTTVNKYQLIV